MSEREGPSAPTSDASDPSDTDATPGDRAENGDSSAHASDDSEDSGGSGSGSAARLGSAGRRLSRTSPFYVGLFGGLGALTAWGLGTMLVEARGVLLLIIVALYLAMGFNPVVEWFTRRRIPRGVGVLAVFVGLASVFGLIITAVAPVVTRQVTALIGQVPIWIAQLRNNHTIRELDHKYDIGTKITDYISQGELARQAAGGLIGFGVVVASTLFAAFVLFVLTLYFLGSLPSIKAAVYRLVPKSRRPRVSALGDEVIGKIGRYVGGQLFVAGLAGVMSYFFLMLAGLGEFAMALAVLVALFDLIPLVGGAVSTVVVTSIGLLTDLKIGIACAIYYVIYQQIENYVILPRVMSHAVRVPGTVVIVAALVGGSLFGMVGALLAVPTAAAILLIMREVIVPRQEAS